MDTPSSALIDALGGTSAVSRMTEAPTSTVHSWRRNGIPRSRLAHLKLIAAQEKPDIPFDSLAARLSGSAVCSRCGEVTEGACISQHCPNRAQVAA